MPVSLKKSKHLTSYLGISFFLLLFLVANNGVFQGPSMSYAQNALPANADQAHVCGDLNGDGLVNIIDGVSVM